MTGNISYTSYTIMTNTSSILSYIHELTNLTLFVAGYFIPTFDWGCAVCAPLNPDQSHCGAETFTVSLLKYSLSQKGIFIVLFLILIS